MNARGIVALSCVLAVSPCAGAQPAPHAAAPLTAPFNDVIGEPPDACWARLYERKNFHGRTLTVAEPARERRLPPRWGFPWDSRYESLAVGPGAVLVLFDDTRLHDRIATFSAGTTVPDLDREMGVFRTIRAVLVTCAH